MTDQDRSAKLRAFYARQITRIARAEDPRIQRAFAAVERERFAGPAPWCVKGIGHDYIETPDDDPAFLYQDLLLALIPQRGLNIGQPSAHARWLDAVAVRPGETVVQIGAGTGYYTAILAELVGSTGHVHAFEIEPDLADRAATNLAPYAQVTVHRRSGLSADLPNGDAVYVNAGVTQPNPRWLELLRPNGRVLFPLTTEQALGGMLLVTRPGAGEVWPARFVSRAAFIACIGGQDPQQGQRLRAAFDGGGFDRVKSLHRAGPLDDTCWLAADGWWLSTREPC